MVNRAPPGDHQRLNIRYVDELPFTAITEGSHQSHLRFIEDADAVLLTPFPMGPANLPNLEAAHHALTLGKPVLLLEADGAAARDFSGGRALELYQRLRERGALPVSSLQDALARLATPRGA